MLLSSESPLFVGASAVCIPGATLLRRNGLTHGSPAGVGMEHGKRITEVPQELGRTLFAPRRIPAGDTGLPTPGS